MKPLAAALGLIGVAVLSPVALPSSVSAQPKAPSKTQPKAPAKTAPKPPAATAPEPVRPSLADLRRDVEVRRADVARRRDASLPGDDELRTHREARATLEESLGRYEARGPQVEPKLPGWRKERDDLKALPQPSPAQTARIQELDIIIREAERVMAEARSDAEATRTKIREVNADIAKLEDRQAGVRREQDAAERALKNTEDALASEEKRARNYLALYDVAARARAFETAMKAPKPPLERAKYDETVGARVADQVALERTAVEAGRYSYDMNGLRQQLHADGARFFQTAKQTANRKPLPGPPANATPVRTKALKDIDALQKAWTQALGKPMLEANDLAPLLDRAQQAVWDMK